MINSKKFTWNQEQREAWEKLLDCLEQNSTLHIFDPSAPSIISTDASQHACAATLTQSCHSRQRLIAAVSRTFTSSEKSASILHKEVLGAIYALQSFSFLTSNSKITLEIDSKALLYIRYAKDSNAHLTRLSLLISEQNIEKIVHTPSSCHDICDSLSRLTGETRRFDSLLKEYAPMTSKEAEILCRKIAIKAGTVFTNNDEINNLGELLHGKSLPSCIPVKKSSKISRSMKIEPTFKPEIQHERTIRRPYGLDSRGACQISKIRLPKYRKLQIKQQKAFSKRQKEMQWRHDKERYSAQSIFVAPENIINHLSDDADLPQEMAVLANSQADPLEEQLPQHTNDPQVVEDAITADNDDNQPKNDNNYDQVLLAGRIIQDGKLTCKIFTRLQREDELFGPIIQSLSHTNCNDKFKIQNDMLFYVKDCVIPRLCVPKILLPAIVRENHNSIFNVHSPLSSMIKRLLAKYYHPDLRKVAEAHTQACVLCQYTLTSKFRESELGTLPQLSKRCYWYCDLCLMSQNPARYLFLAVDSATLFSFALALDDKSESSIYSAILILLSLFTPQCLRFDNESGVFGLVSRLDNLGVKIEFTPVGSSFSNGLVERRIGTAKEIIRSLRAMDDSMTNKELATLITMNLNRRIVFGQKFCSELLMFNSTVPSPHSLLNISENCTKDDELLPQFKREFAAYIKDRKANAAKQKGKYNASRRKSKFLEGDIVYVTNRNLISGQKSLRCTRSGPYTVEKLEDGGLAAILKHVSTNAYIKRRLSYLTPAASFQEILLNHSWENQLLAENRKNEEA